MHLNFLSNIYSFVDQEVQMLKALCFLHDVLIRFRVSCIIIYSSASFTVSMKLILIVKRDLESFSYENYHCVLLLVLDFLQ